MIGKKDLCIGFIIICFLISPVSAQDWNMFHGNLDHTGYIDEASDFTP